MPSLAFNRLPAARGILAIAIAILTAILLCAADAEAKSPKLTLKVAGLTDGGAAVQLKVLSRTPRRAGRNHARLASKRRTISLQQAVGGEWRTIGSRRLSRRGRLQAVVRPQAASGSARLRAKARRSTSRVVEVRLPAPPAPAVPPTPTPPPSPQTPPPSTEHVQVGFNNNAVWDKVATAGQAADLLAGVGADVDRVQINWEQLEPAPGSYQFAKWDAVYAADIAKGIKPLFILGFAPDWADGGVCDGESSCHAPPAPDFYDDYARTAAALAVRYPQAAGIEIWNEPNAPYFWRPAPDPVAYAELLAVSYAEIKAANPSMPVAGASTASGLSGSVGKIAYTRFISTMLDHGAGSSMDAISMHAYPDPLAGTAVDAVERVQSISSAFGFELPIWVTETGSTTTGEGALAEADQATLLTALDTQLSAVPGVEMVLFHTLVEPPRGATSPESGYGVVTADGRAKPAYCALGDAWDRPEAC
jgi:hypothetical protein